jgi:hypothetical protein|tara:strand:- start:100 stop:375 length:276 start_codon:yes stop_codon:yes gene_type:complete
MNDNELRNQINQLIRDEIQEGINEYIDYKDQVKESGLGFVEKDDEKELKVNVSEREIDKIMKQYKKIKKSQKSNLGQIKKLNLLDQYGRQL